jgi:hypothetical protein
MWHDMPYCTSYSENVIPRFYSTRLSLGFSTGKEYILKMLIQSKTYHHVYFHLLWQKFESFEHYSYMHYHTTFEINCTCLFWVHVHSYHLLWSLNLSLIWIHRLLEMTGISFFNLSLYCIAVCFVCHISILLLSPELKSNQQPCGTGVKIPYSHSVMVKSVIVFLYSFDVRDQFQVMMRWVCRKETHVLDSALCDGEYLTWNQKYVKFSKV